MMNDRMQFRVAKDGREALVNVRFDDESGKVEQVNAFPLLLNVAGQQPSRSYSERITSVSSGRHAENDA